ncbi:MAG: hypothetical protein PVJ89_14485 [Planctomycetota bacterium]|jgi:antitoxin component YwqK of YwqJK toxin-antitoxin module
MPKSSTASILLPLALAVAALGAGCGPRYEGIIASAFDRNARRQGPAQPRLEREVSGEQDSGAPLEERSFLHLPDGQRPNHGVHSTWYPDGTPRTLRSYELGEPVGVWWTWWQNGALRSAHTFDPERPTRMVWWHANGLVASEGMALLGVRTGRWRSWHENGEQESEGDYVGGQRVGAWVFYDEEGEWSERGRFVSGRRVGDWEFASRPGF